MKRECFFEAAVQLYFLEKAAYAAFNDMRESIRGYCSTKRRPWLGTMKSVLHQGTLVTIQISFIHKERYIKKSWKYIKILKKIKL